MPPNLSTIKSQITRSLIKKSLVTIRILELSKQTDRLKNGECEGPSLSKPQNDKITFDCNYFSRYKTIATTLSFGVTIERFDF